VIVLSEEAVSLDEGQDDLVGDFSGEGAALFGDFGFAAELAALVFDEVEPDEAQQLAMRREVGEGTCFCDEASESDFGNDARLRGRELGVESAEFVIELLESSLCSRFAVFVGGKVFEGLPESELAGLVDALGAWSQRRCECVFEKPFDGLVLDSRRQAFHFGAEVIFAGGYDEVGVEAEAVQQGTTRGAIDEVFFEWEVRKQSSDVVVDGAFGLDHGDLGLGVKQLVLA